DGSLLISGGNSTIAFDEKTKNIDTAKEVTQTEEYETYENAVENQVKIEEN
ncbi:putative cellsurface protein, partial [Listeria innocua FSL S4-378]